MLELIPERFPFFLDCVGTSVPAAGPVHGSCSCFLLASSHLPEELVTASVDDFLQFVALRSDWRSLHPEDDPGPILFS